MERFIGATPFVIFKKCPDLKSSMERFIVLNSLKSILNFVVFKIQYGEIYSHLEKVYGLVRCYLKSSMERFIDLKQIVLKNLQII